ncbi:MAG: VWA domain-containing protein [Phycisphaerales bacterium]|nr:VWA domain-containing protein [Phycisphaerales bacterium]
MTSLRFNPNTPDHSGGSDMEQLGAHLPDHPLDATLRAWHDENRGRAEALRDETLAKARATGALDATPTPASLRFPTRPATRGWIPRLVAAAALLATMVTLGILFSETSQKSAFADGGIVQVPEGGELSALDENGNVLGPCPLQHTDVVAEASGPFVRTVIEQVYANPYPRKIEALYTFPLSNAAAVDRMTMIVRGPSGEIVVESEVKERQAARMMYEAARESGYVASLLEQERPNIFTQSVANIEPGATVRIRIATVEMVQRRDGVYSWSFPTVVGPRYIPGRPASMPTLPEGFSVREGVVLRAPAAIETKDGCFIPAPRLLDLLTAAIPVRTPDAARFDVVMQAGEPWRFDAKYGNGSVEFGSLWQSGVGEINGRWFYAKLDTDPGAGFSTNTDQVPDAARITPMPVHPTERAGHDLSIRVNIDSGGATLKSVSSTQHFVEVVQTSATRREVKLVGGSTIPNKDFILSWQVENSSIEPAFFAHVDSEGSGPRPANTKGGYFMLMLEPPARVASSEVRPRELIFVLDTSGSMSGFPIEKAKEVMSKSIAKMRPTDTFNVMTFAGDTRILWPEPKSASPENIAAAQAMVDRQEGGGGTEMMTAINAALVQPGRSALEAAKLLELPADGRVVKIAVKSDALGTKAITLANGQCIPIELAVAMPTAVNKVFLLEGRWLTKDATRVFAIDRAEFQHEDARTRYVMFLTDAYIGNDQGVIAAIRDNVRASRVFSFGIGSSVNRYLIEEMARAGNGASEVVTLAEGADEVVERFVRRIENPVLTDIEISFDASLGATALLPGGGTLPDLFDQSPLVVLGRFDANGKATRGEAIVRGRTAAGAWEKRITVEFPAVEQEHDVVETLWARAKVDDILLPHMAAVESDSLDPKIHRAIVQLGEDFHIATRYTSFVAVEKSRVTVGGRSMLVAVPIELPEGTSWAGCFGEGMRATQLRDEHLAKQYFGIEARGDSDRGDTVSAEAAMVKACEPGTSFERTDELRRRSGVAADSSSRTSDRSTVGGRTGGWSTGVDSSNAPLSPRGGGGAGSGGGFGGGANAPTGSPALSPQSMSVALSATSPTFAMKELGKSKGKSSSSTTPPMPGAPPVTQPQGAVGAEPITYSARLLRFEIAPRVEAARELEHDAKQSETDIPTNVSAPPADTTKPQANPTDAQVAATQLTRADLDLLARRLGKELALVAVAAELDPSTLPAILEGLGITLDSEGRMQVIVLMEEISKAALDRIKSTGARVLETDRKIAILELKPSELLKLARLAGVRKVDSLPSQQPEVAAKSAKAA